MMILHVRAVWTNEPDEPFFGTSRATTLSASPPRLYSIGEPWIHVLRPGGKPWP